jgi:L-seryl-tRNA(Ser) seleniumtransferase
VSFDKNKLLRNIPAVDEIMKNQEVIELFEEFPREMVLNAVKLILDEKRKKILNLGSSDQKYLDGVKMVKKDEIIQKIDLMKELSLKRVINATGIIIHTNIGRAPLSEEAVNAVIEAAKYYSNLEFDISTGKRGKRYTHVKSLLQDITGAESGIVVNNNAAAVLLCLSTFAKGYEVIISRGELIEIGGSFRIPEIMEQSGAKLVEVGSTNRTHIEDYKNAITEKTKMILKVHTSNYRVVGFTSEVGLDDLNKLAKDYNLPLLLDMGSGNFMPAEELGLKDEPTVQDEVLSGADIVTFSGDKLLGGPQAGIIVGKNKYIDRLAKSPLNRALRVDKLTLAALEATLKAYVLSDEAAADIPVIKMLKMSEEELKNRADHVVRTIKNKCSVFKLSVCKDSSQVGGGAYPLHDIPTYVVSLDSTPLSVNKFESLLRSLKTPVIARIKNDRVLFDMRTLLDDEVEILPDLICSLAQQQP